MTLFISSQPLISALLLYMVWVFTTYLLEGRLHTLLRPEAKVQRFLYTVVANIFVGVVLSGWLLHAVNQAGGIALGQAGIQGIPHIVVAMFSGLALGFVVYWYNHPPSTSPTVILNGFILIWPTSTAEIMVCWAVVGTVCEALLNERAIPGATIIAALIASVLFSAYHIAHSPPFNSTRMMILLTGVGLVISCFFYISRDLYGTIVFHNCFALLGILRALRTPEQLKHFEVVAMRFVITASISLAVLIAVQIVWLAH